MVIISCSETNQTAVRCGFDEGWITREQGNSNVRGEDVGTWDVKRTSGTALNNVRFSTSLISDNAHTDLSNWNRRLKMATTPDPHHPSASFSTSPPPSRDWRRHNSDICAPSRIMHTAIFTVLFNTPSTTTKNAKLGREESRRVFSPTSSCYCRTSSRNNEPGHC
jgi:hypothetical protein